MSIIFYNFCFFCAEYTDFYNENLDKEPGGRRENEREQIQEKLDCWRRF